MARKTLELYAPARPLSATMTRTRTFWGDSGTPNRRVAPLASRAVSARMAEIALT